MRLARHRVGTIVALAAAALLAVAAPASAAPARRIPIGCTAHGPALVYHGSSGRPVVALTFDDGPWNETPAILRVLAREHVPATFFLLGRQVAGHGALLRRMLAQGSMIADHTWDHADLSGDGAFAAREIRRTARAIERASGFRPCLFRAPFGSLSPALVRQARTLGFTTVQWDVDPRDWSLPGTATIVARILATVHDGAIVLMHDGGGPRAQTLAALPLVIDALRARGYRFATVTRLTGATLRYR